MKALEDQALHELDLLNYPPRENWVPARKTSSGEHVYDVAIVGGGQTGIALAFSLLREKVDNIILFDARKKGEEGEWLSHARMDILRTPKHTIGPDCDIPSLTVRAWYEAKYSADAWEKLDYIPRVEWAAYIQWLRNFLHLPIHNETVVGAIEWIEKENCFLVPLTSKGLSDHIYARKIILATGLQGSGEWGIPQHIRKNIPHGRYFHTSDPIDFSLFKGKKIGILGGGPCAFDNAWICSQSGASEVHMFFKRSKLVNLHVFRWGEYVGFLKSFPSLPDDSKWEFIAKMYEIGQPPTLQAVAAVRMQNNIFMHFDSPWIDSKMNQENNPTVITPKSVYSFDYLIIATGWIIDLTLRPELSKFREQIALWNDKFTPPVHQQYEALLRAPYLGKGYQFIEKVEGKAPYLKSIFNMTGGALVSTGFSAGTGITGMKYSLKALTDELVNQLFIEDRKFFFNTLDTYDEYLFEN